MPLPYTYHKQSSQEDKNTCNFEEFLVTGGGGAVSNLIKYWDNGKSNGNY